MSKSFQNFTLDYETPVDPELQRVFEEVDANIRAEFAMTSAQTAAGLLDLKTTRLAMLRPDAEFYGASVPKIAILLAYFALRPADAANMDADTRHELGLMIKASSNELAAKFSKQLGLAKIQQVLDSYQFYDAHQGGGLWVGKHYGDNTERLGSPVGNNSHAATVRQLLRFYLLLEQGRLVSTAASEEMREIFASPHIPHDEIKFARGLTGRDVTYIRKWGSWEDWLHDTGVVMGPGRHYILVGLTNHPRGDDYLSGLAAAVDRLMSRAL